MGDVVWGMGQGDVWGYQWGNEKESNQNPVGSGRGEGVVHVCVSCSHGTRSLKCNLIQEDESCISAVD